LSRDQTKALLSHRLGDVSQGVNGGMKVHEKPNLSNDSEISSGFNSGITLTFQMKGLTLSPVWT
jgi:hypothetical protein